MSVLVPLTPWISSAGELSLVQNDHGSYDAIYSADPGDPPAFALDMFIKEIGDAQMTDANTNGNPFAFPALNLNPPGNPDAVLIGGSEISGSGISGVIKLGEITWNGKGILGLYGNFDCCPECLAICEPRGRGCFLDLTGTQLLLSERPFSCSCGDANNNGALESADLLIIFNCLRTDPLATGACSGYVVKGDTNGTGVFETADLIGAWEALRTGGANEAELSCPLNQQ